MPRGGGGPVHSDSAIVSYLEICHEKKNERPAVVPDGVVDKHDVRTCNAFGDTCG